MHISRVLFMIFLWVVLNLVDNRKRKLTEDSTEEPLAKKVDQGTMPV